jgi:hypothetical protein
VEHPDEHKGISKDYAKEYRPLNTGFCATIIFCHCNEATPVARLKGTVYDTEASYTVPCPALY